MTAYTEAIARQHALEVEIAGILRCQPDIVKAAADDSIRLEIVAEGALWGDTYRREFRGSVRWQKQSLARCRRISDPIGRATALLRQHHAFQDEVADIMARARFRDGSGAQRARAGTDAAQEIGSFETWVSRLIDRLATEPEGRNAISPRTPDFSQKMT